MTRGPTEIGQIFNQLALPVPVADSDGFEDPNCCRSRRTRNLEELSDSDDEGCGLGLGIEPSVPEIHKNFTKSRVTKRDPPKRVRLYQPFLSVACGA
jgi:hypothetical protein